MPSLTTDDGVELYYEAWGSGDAGLIVEPGMFASTETARSFAALSEDGLRVVAYDGRGTGRSGKPDPSADAYSVDRLTQDSLALTDQLGFESVIGLGWFNGAHRAVRRAVERPEQTAAIILCGPSLALVRDLPISAPMGSALKELFGRGFNYGVYAYVDSGMPDATPEQKAVAKSALRDSTTSEVASAIWKALSATDDRSLLERVLCPALVIAGADDIVVPPEHVRELVNALPAGRLAELDGAGNAMWFTRSEETLGLVREFLRSLALSAPATQGEQASTLPLADPRQGRT